MTWKRAGVDLARVAKILSWLKCPYNIVNHQGWTVTSSMKRAQGAKILSLLKCRCKIQTDLVARGRVYFPRPERNRFVLSLSLSVTVRDIACAAIYVLEFHPL